MANPNALRRDDAIYMVSDGPDMGSGMSERLFQLAFPDIYAKADSYRNDIRRQSEDTTSPTTFHAALGMTSLHIANRLNVFDIHTLTEIYTWVVYDGWPIDHDILKIAMGAVLHRPYSQLLFLNSEGVKVKTLPWKHQRHQTFYLTITSADAPHDPECPICHRRCDLDDSLHSHGLRAVNRMEGIALVCGSAHSPPMTNVHYPAVKPSDIEGFRFVPNYSAVFRNIRTIKDCKSGLRKLRDINDKVIDALEPFTQEDLSDVRLLYRQFENLIWYLLASRSPTVAGYVGPRTRDHIGIRKASKYYNAYVAKASHLLDVVDMRTMIEVD